MELRQAWCKETARPSDQTKWDGSNPSLGQCVPTVLLMQDIYGGTIHSCKVGRVSHFVLILDDGELFDPTSEQFQQERVIYSQLRSRNRSQLLNNSDVSHRYELLKTRYMEVI